MRTTRFIAATLLIAGTVFAPYLTQAQPSGIGRSDVLRQDLGDSVREVIQVRVDFAPGAAFGRHTHPGEEIAYVLEGVLEYQIDGKAPVTLKAGDAVFIPAGTVHAARNVGTSKASELATYVVQKGKPLVVMTE
jgi:quercetin dioxygenase-like cupin family protein